MELSDLEQFYFTYSFYTTIILFPLSILSIIPVWISCDIHRTLPFWNNKYRQKRFERIIPYTNCQTVKPWMFTEYIGHKFIVQIIMRYAAEILKIEKSKNIREFIKSYYWVPVMLVNRQYSNN